MARSKTTSRRHGKHPAKSPAIPLGGSSTQRKYRRRPGTVALREIRRYQASTELLIPKLPFARVVRETTLKFVPHGEVWRWTAEALQAMQCAAEAFLQGLFEDAYLCTLHSKRVTLLPRDMRLARQLRGRYGDFI
ncbi:putative centromere protein A [Cryptosporidium serpentis]|uniref:Centromere protein A n=1 Tax=Cryptosporidium andersoni TaxID=117008 RepID=A0A1J4MUC4_9CRYT|nr:centromere protein A [Cryptosporidium andersoni]